ncbi:hypothetical protein ACHAWF_012710 [Thalassiosira exigua]
MSLLVDFPQQPRSRFRPRVSFEHAPQMNFIQDLSVEHKEDLWFSHREMATFQRDYKVAMARNVLAFGRVESSDWVVEVEDTSVFLGLESSLSKSRLKEIALRRRALCRAIMVEQERQRRLGVRDPEAFGRISAEETESSRERARVSFCGDGDASKSGLRLDTIPDVPELDLVCWVPAPLRSWLESCMPPPAVPCIPIRSVLHQHPFVPLERLVQRDALVAIVAHVVRDDVLAREGIVHQRMAEHGEGREKRPLVRVPRPLRGGIVKGQKPRAVVPVTRPIELVEDLPQDGNGPSVAASTRAARRRRRLLLVGLDPVERPLHDVPGGDDPDPPQGIAVVAPGRDERRGEHAVREVAQVDPPGRAEVPSSQQRPPQEARVVVARAGRRRRRAAGTIGGVGSVPSPQAVHQRGRARRDQIRVLGDDEVHGPRRSEVPELSVRLVGGDEERPPSSSELGEQSVQELAAHRAVAAVVVAGRGRAPRAPGGGGAASDLRLGPRRLVALAGRSVVVVVGALGPRSSRRRRRLRRRLAIPPLRRPPPRSRPLPHDVPLARGGVPVEHRQHPRAALVSQELDPPQHERDALRDVLRLLLPPADSRPLVVASSSLDVPLSAASVALGRGPLLPPDALVAQFRPAQVREVPPVDESRPVPVGRAGDPPVHVHGDPRPPARPPAARRPLAPLGGGLVVVVASAVVAVAFAFAAFPSSLLAFRRLLPSPSPSLLRGRRRRRRRGDAVREGAEVVTLPSRRGEDPGEEAVDAHGL